MTADWKFLRMAAMLPPADQLANPLQHTRLADAELLTREAVQNTADERKDDAEGPVKFSVKRQLYKGEEKSAFIKGFRLAELAERAKELPATLGWFKFEETCLAKLDNPDVPISALVLSDYNTKGLGGAWNRDGKDNRFYNLVLSIYGSHKTEDADLLGSYGIGKMVYAVNSNIRTIAYYSAFEPDADSEGDHARFMATGFFPRHTTDDDIDYAGYAFFGADSGDQYFPAQPLSNSDAHELAEQVGFERRYKADTGLSVMLLDCNISIPECVVACEKYWWPRILSTDPAFHVELEFIDGKNRVTIPDPKARADLKTFIDCYSNLEQRVRPDGYELKPINLAGQRQVGRLCLTELDANTAEDNDLANTVSLIRGGLIVQYCADYAREGDPDVVGVFEASDEKAKQAFTLSEPEAHDEWNYNNARLKRSMGDEAVTWVRRTHERIKESFRDYQTRLKEAPKPQSGDGLDFLDDILGPIFKKRKKGPPRPPEQRRRAFKVSKKGWRDLKTDPVVDKLQFTVSLSDDIDVESTICQVRAVLRVLEDADGRPGDTIACEIFDDEGGLVMNGSESFEVELLSDQPQNFHASAHVHPSWRTKWTISVVGENPESGEGP